MNVYYILERVIGAGYAEYVGDISRFTLTDDPRSAQQMDGDGLAMMDMEYLEHAGFRAAEISGFGLAPAPERLFTPPLPSFRPRIPRRRPGAMVPRTPGHLMSIPDRDRD